MEQRKEIVNLFVQKGLRVETAVWIAGISKSTFYYKSKKVKRGKVASKFTKKDGVLIPNEKVVEVIEEILGEEFIDY